MGKKVSVDEHNAELAKKISKLEDELAELKSQFKSEALKPQASLAECLAMAKKSAKPKVSQDKVKPKTKSL